MTDQTMVDLTDEARRQVETYLNAVSAMSPAAWKLWMERFPKALEEWASAHGGKDASRWWKEAYDDTVPELIIQRGGRGSETMARRSQIAFQVGALAKDLLVRTGGPETVSAIIQGSLRALSLRDHLSPDTFDILYSAAPLEAFTDLEGDR